MDRYVKSVAFIQKWGVRGQADLHITEFFARLMALDLQSLIIVALRLYFLSTTAAVLLVHFVPPLHRAFIPYGKTRGTPSSSSHSVLDRISEITVPKAWFWHYYLVSVSLSICWGFVFVWCSKRSEFCVFPWLRMGNGRAWLVWGMMLVQGCRRLYESLFVLKSSSARMWIGHYLVGCAFYTMMSVAVIAENCPNPHRMTP